MWKDPIVEEVRKIREQLAARFDYDLRKIFEDARQREQEHPERVVSFVRDAKRKPPRKRKRA